MEDTKEKILSDKMSGLTDEACDTETVVDSDINEAIHSFENDSDVQRLKAQEAEKKKKKAKRRMAKKSKR